MYTLDITVRDVKLTADFDYEFFTETAFLGFLGIWHKGEKVGHLLSFNIIQQIAHDIGVEMRANPPSAEKIAENAIEMQSFRDSSDQYAEAQRMDSKSSGELTTSLLLQALGIRDKNTLRMVAIEDFDLPPPTTH